MTSPAPQKFSDQKSIKKTSQSGWKGRNNPEISSRFIKKPRTNWANNTPPIPLGNSHYAKAKQAEFLQKNFQRAEQLYLKAIQTGDRAESSIKDLASLLHQQGKTDQAVDLMLRYQHLATEEPEKFSNLLQNLQKQSLPTGNSVKKCLMVSIYNTQITPQGVKKMFTDQARITEIKIKRKNKVTLAYLYFSSHSSARKTLETFKFFDEIKIEWISITGENLGDANPARYKQEYRRKNPPFSYQLFERDQDTWVLPMPVDVDNSQNNSYLSDQAVPDLLGQDLYKEIFIR